jgi:O-succinylbenzoate synthase
MKDKVQIHKYTTHFESPPNALSTAGLIEGALIRRDGGYGCLQPWPSLGDEDLNYHLQSIVKSDPTEQVLACLKCCEIDADARTRGIDLFNDLIIPRSHLSVPLFPIREIINGTREDFTHIKVKGNNEVLKVAHYLEMIPEKISIRVDFNSSLSPNEFIEFTRELSPNCLQHIDFIEDPFPYDPNIWEQYSNQTGLNFALDRGPKDATLGFAVRIWKPTIFPQLPDSMPICVTHNMDHELGRRYATYQSAIIDNAVSVHGTGIFDELKNGYGLGMTEILEELQWEELA